MLMDEVSRGWQLILPREVVLQLPRAVLAPLGLIEQDTINEFGEIVPKWRLTHDQSFNVIKQTSRSVNDRLITEDLTPCIYGKALHRHIHFVAGLRKRHPTTRILQTKVDWKSAYRRLHNSAETAIQLIVAVDIYILIALRLTFGGAANPSQWSDVSELATDLANDLVRDDGWDHDVHFSPHQHLLKDSVKFEDSAVPIAQVSELAVHLPADDAPKSDCYIDDIFTFLETDVKRGSRVVPFILHLLGQPLAPNESLDQDDILSLKKLLAEATPAERQTILGWIVDTRRLLIALPANKFKAWSASIGELLQKDTVTHKEMETIIGRLNHAGFIIPMARHFLGRLRTAMYAASHRRSIRLTMDQRDDLGLWLRFLRQATNGISLNLITFRLPTHIGCSDACEHGIGGFSATTGVAWRWEIPLELRWRVTLNVLEYLAGYVTLWMEILVGNAPRGSCFLSQTDSTSAAGWLRKSSFNDRDPLHLEVARATASLIMDHHSCLYSQWFQGKLNNVADALSRDHHLSDLDLLTLLYSAVPEQVPEGFKICPLPPVVVSRITTWLRSLPPATQSPTEPQPSGIATGGIGKPTSNSSNSRTTPTSASSPEVSKTELLQDLALPSERTTSKTTRVHQMLLRQYLAQSAPPLMLWHRPSGKMTCQVHAIMATDVSPSFSNDA